MPIEKQKQTFLGQAFEDEPFGFAYDKYGNLIPGTEARPLKVKDERWPGPDSGRSRRELFPEEPPLEPVCDDLSDIDDLVALIDKIAAPGLRF